MTIWILSLSICTMWSGGVGSSTICNMTGGQGYFASESLCERAGKAGVAQEPWRDDIAGVTHRNTEFKCFSVAVTDK